MITRKTIICDALEPVLKRTLGIPLFQEQMLQMAMIMAEFFRGRGSGRTAPRIEFSSLAGTHGARHRKMRAAFSNASATPENLIDKVADTVCSFALYGFPESHAISFAHLAYASAYLKAHRPQEFYTSLLNNQPMGFYASSTLIKDAQRRGVTFRPVCVCAIGLGLLQSTLTTASATRFARRQSSEPKRRWTFACRTK